MSKLCCQAFCSNVVQARHLCQPCLELARRQGRTHEFPRMSDPLEVVPVLRRSTAKERAHRAVRLARFAAFAAMHCKAPEVTS
ncbi:hypothetical protein [Pseudomonas benzopyrenica]|uniref:hypothetical protein n=1 Tax=Pseudomonas benzopyrenica TaxID=2993566 RepID=UPI003F144AE5